MRRAPLLPALPLLLALAGGVALPSEAWAETPIWMLARSLHPASLPPRAPASAQAGTPGQQCRAAIAAAAQRDGIPAPLMQAIGRVESGRRDADGHLDPWPWSINVEGADHVYQTREAALAAVRTFQAAGARSIDVGCMQVNLMYHPDAFSSLEDAFDPARNAAYAASFLKKLYAQGGSWPIATAWYHSATPDLGADYQRKVMAALSEDDARPVRSETASSEAPAPVLASAQAQPGPVFWGNRVVHARLLPGALPPGGPGVAGAGLAGAGLAGAGLAGAGLAGVGRGLAAYRANPVLIASRVALR